MVFETKEIRWFYPGPLPGVLLSAFQGAPIPGVREQRTDWYFVGDQRTDLGLKLRAGSWFDLKRRTGVQPDQAFGEKMRGDVEDWVKWSFALAADAADEAGAFTKAHGWQQVHKTRWIRRYEVGGTDRASAVPFEHTIELGCNAELSEVWIDGALSWSLGFETVGSTDALGPALIAAVSMFHADTPDLAGVRFGRADSHSYPAWLAEGTKPGHDTASPPAPP